MTRTPKSVETYFKGINKDAPDVGEHAIEAYSDTITRVLSYRYGDRTSDSAEYTYLVVVTVEAAKRKREVDIRLVRDRPFDQLMTYKLTNLFPDPDVAPDSLQDVNKTIITTEGTINDISDPYLRRAYQTFFGLSHQLMGHMHLDKLFNISEKKDFVEIVSAITADRLTTDV